MPKQYIAELCAINREVLDSKLKISPVGEVTGLDGRVFEIDGQAVLQRLLDTGLELVLTIAHEYGGKAAGWFNDFELKDDGIYAALTLNDMGTDLLESQSYKYLSPEYFVDYNTNDVFRIVGVGLVNQPNLLNEALNHFNPLDKQESHAMGDQTHTSDSADLQAQVDQLTQDNKALADQNAELIQQLNTNKVDNAINAGKLAPAKRDFALGLENNALDNYLAVEAQTFQKTENNGITQEDSHSDNDDTDCPILAQLRLDEEA